MSCTAYSFCLDHILLTATTMGSKWNCSTMLWPAFYLQEATAYPELVNQRCLANVTFYKKCANEFPLFPNPFLKSWQRQFTSMLSPPKHSLKHHFLPLMLHSSTFLWKSFSLNTLYCKSNSIFYWHIFKILIICRNALRLYGRKF